MQILEGNEESRKVYGPYKGEQPGKAKGPVVYGRKSREEGREEWKKKEKAKYKSKSSYAGLGRNRADMLKKKR